jgi:hypothetical protein
MVVKGKANFTELGQSIETSIVKSSVTSLEKQSLKGLSSLFPGLSSVAGLGKHDGSTQQQALYVTFNGSTVGIPGLSNLPLGNGLGQTLLGNFGGGASSGANGGSGGAIGGFISSAVGTLGSAFKSIGSFFGGFLAGGGDTQPGKAYVVGEKRPELFIPGQAGRVVPNVPTSSGNIQHITLQQTIVTPDADSFRRSQGQVASGTASMLSRGASRLGR